MASYRQIYYHIVFGTKNRAPTIQEETEKTLFAYIWGIVKNKQCKLFQINGTSNHIHLLTDLHPSLALADFVREIKAASSKWMRESGNFHGFTSWGEGYGAFTLSIRERNHVIQYIKRQKDHHLSETFYDEYKRLLMENGVSFDEKYMLG
ncbi:hypothetical protein GCM10028791_30310 [Echinicola sediminis]